MSGKNSVNILLCVLINLSYFSIVFFLFQKNLKLKKIIFSVLLINTLEKY